MAGPFVEFLKSAALRGVSVLADLGGYDKVNDDPVDDPDLDVDAEENNKIRQAISDIVADRWKELDVEWFSLTTINDGVADAKPAFDATVAYAKANGRNIELRGSGTYRLSKGVLIDAAHKLRIVSRSGAKIVFPSSDQALGNEIDYASDATNTRSAFFVKNSDDLSFEGLIGEGDSVEASVFINLGKLVSLQNCARATLLNCHSKYGGGLVTQTGQANDYGARAIGCTSYAARGNSRLAGWFLGCYFELPEDADYDRVGDNGSSHAIYWYGSSADHCGVGGGTTFKNIRLSPVKVSGSAVDKLNYLVDGISMVNCGPIIMGADDVNGHNLISARNIHAVDCPNIVQILGGRGTAVSKIDGYFTQVPAATGAVVAVLRYTTSSQPVEGCVVEDVNLSAPAHLGAANLATHGVTVTRIGLGGAKVGSVAVRRIRCNYVGNVGVLVDSCVCPEIDDVVTHGCTYALVLNSNRRPTWRNVVALEQPSNGATIRHDGKNTWPKERDVHGGGRTAGLTISAYTGKAQLGNTGGTVEVNPLLGCSGFVTATGGKPEIVFAYGSDWTAAGTSSLGRCSNDPVDTNGTITLTNAHDHLVNFPIGSRFFASANSNSSAPRTGTATVTAVDPSAGTVTFSGTITGITSNDYLFAAADTIDFNGTTLTYVSGAPGANQFNSQATLITAINALGGGTTYAAADFGADFSPAVTTGHVCVRRQAASSTANLFYMKPSTRSPLACDILVNYSLLQDRCYSRGENVAATAWAGTTAYVRGDIRTNGGNLYMCVVAGTSAGAGGPTTTAMDITDGTVQWRYLGAGTSVNGVVIWSPYIRRAAPPVLQADNTAARGALSMAAPLRYVNESGDEQACCTYHIPGLAGGERFAWVSI